LPTALSVQSDRCEQRFIGWLAYIGELLVDLSLDILLGIRTFIRCSAIRLLRPVQFRRILLVGQDALPRHLVTL
jgi:hypothetical protein